MPHLRIRHYAKLYIYGSLNLHLWPTFSGQNLHHIMIQGNVFPNYSKLKSVTTEGHNIRMNKSHWAWHICRLAQKGVQGIQALSYRNTWCTRAYEL